jgi:uncharacterized membrane protein YkoI
MRVIIGCFNVCAVAGLLALATVARADEQKISPDKLPKAVAEAVKNRFPNGKITSAEKETENGKVVYDIELKQKGRHYEMDIQEDGTIVEIEKQVDEKNLPEAVRKALEDKYPKATIKEIMEVNKVTGKEEKPMNYEITITTADNKSLEVTISLDGKKVKASKAEEEKK